ncbi:Odorant receptor 74 [Frankliniella occidentalis]|nr:Odorant receptor 74 [Frankliniella occidentalis]
MHHNTWRCVGLEDLCRGGPLTLNLRWWLHHVTHEGKHDNVLRWLLFKLRGSRALLARRARKGRFMRWFFVMHAVATEVTFVFTLSIWAPTWLQHGVEDKEIWKDWTRWIVLSLQYLFLQASGLLAGLASVYTFLPLVLQVTMASADLMYILGKKLEVGRCTRTMAATESAMISACLLSDECVSDVIAPVVFASLLMPLISLVQVMSGVVDSLDALGTAPLFITITVPLYLAGDMLASARQGIANSAARGPWLEEEPWQRRMRAAVMLGASGEGALPRCQGVGILNRRGLAHVLRSWFSFLQAMLNLRRGAKVAG